MFGGGLIVRSHEQPSGPRVVTEQPNMIRGFQSSHALPRAALAAWNISAFSRAIDLGPGSVKLGAPCYVERYT